MCESHVSGCQLAANVVVKAQPTLIQVKPSFTISLWVR